MYREKRLQIKEETFPWPFTPGQHLCDFPSKIILVLSFSFWNLFVYASGHYLI